MKAIRFEDVRDVGFFLFAAGWIVVVFANSGVITGSLMIILGADILIAESNLIRVRLKSPGDDVILSEPFGQAKSLSGQNMRFFGASRLRMTPLGRVLTVYLDEQEAFHAKRCC